MTNKIKRMIRKKKRLYNKAKKSSNNSDSKTFHDYRKSVRNLLHTEYYRYINNLLEHENDSSSKSFWKYIKSRKQDSVSIGTLKDNDNIAESANVKAEMFNSQFCSDFNKEDMENMPDKVQLPKGQSSHRVMPTIDILYCEKVESNENMWTGQNAYFSSKGNFQ